MQLKQEVAKALQVLQLIQYISYLIMNFSKALSLLLPPNLYPLILLSIGVMNTEMTAVQAVPSAKPAAESQAACIANVTYLANAAAAGAQAAVISTAANKQGSSLQVATSHSLLKTKHFQ